MMHLLCYPLLAGCLSVGSPSPAISFAASRPSVSSAQPAADTLQQQAQAYTRYLTHVLQLQGRQPAATARCTEAFLRELDRQGPTAAPGLQLRYLEAMREVLNTGQYAAFCWLQEREQAAAVALPPAISGPNTSRR